MVGNLILNITQKWSGKMCFEERSTKNVSQNDMLSCYLSLLGDITQKGYEKKRAKVLAPYLTQTQSKDYRNISSVHLLFCHIISLSLFFLSGPLTHMIMWLWNIFSGCSSWGGGFNLESLCTAIYCSWFGLQHELLLFYSCKICRICWADLSFFMLERYEMKTKAFHIYFTFISSIFCNHWLRLLVCMKFTVSSLSLQI